MAEKRRVPPPASPEALARKKAAQFQPGESPNPGGAPKGKRISTWMTEIGQMTDDELTAFRRRKDLPKFAKIALATLDRAEDGGTQANGAADITLDRTEGKVAQTHNLTSLNPHSQHDIEQTMKMLERMKDALEADGG